MKQEYSLTAIAYLRENNSENKFEGIQEDVLELLNKQEGTLMCITDLLLPGKSYKITIGIKEES